MQSIRVAPGALSPDNFEFERNAIKFLVFDVLRLHTRAADFLKQLWRAGRVGPQVPRDIDTGHRWVMANSLSYVNDAAHRKKGIVKPFVLEVSRWDNPNLRLSIDVRI